MNKLICCGSSSSGNSYIIQCEEEVLLLELGVNFKEVVKALDYKMEKAVGALCSHVHQDHAKYTPSALQYGLQVYSCQEVADKYKGVTIIKPKTRVNIGRFSVQAIPVQHNAECYAYLIEYPNIGKLLFATDLNGFPYKIKNLNHIMLEANYDEEIILQNACNDKWNSSQSDNHLSLDKAIEILKVNYSVELQSIILLHLSDGNSNAEEFKERVYREIGIKPYIADKGLIVGLNKEEF